MKSRLSIWSSLSIRVKLLVIMLYTLLLIFASNIILFVNVNKMTARLDNIYASNVDLTELSASLAEIQSNMYRYVEVRDYASLQQYYVAVEYFKGDLAQFSKRITDNEVDILETNIVNMSEAFINEADKAIAAKRGMDVEGYDAYYEQAMKIYDYIESDITTLNDLLFKNNVNSYRSLQQALRYLEVSSFGILIAVMVLGIILLIRMTGDIVSPLSQLAAAARKVGEGNLDQRVDMDVNEDEIGVVTDAFNGMVDSLNGYVVQIKESAEIEKELREKELMMENNLQEAQLRFLQAQINPHFLFNSLNAGVQLAEMEDDEKTAEFLDRMAEFFRYNVKKDKEVSTIGEEIKVVEDYIYILNVRYAGDIKFIQQIDKNALDHIMPGMILQPLVENALNHGIKENLSDGWIKLSVRDAGDTVELEVADNGKGMSQEKITQILSAEPSAHKDEELGIGVDNVISRLKLYFGIDHVCDIESEGENKGTSVKLYIPKKGLE